MQVTAMDANSRDTTDFSLTPEPGDIEPETDVDVDSGSPASAGSEGAPSPGGSRRPVRFVYSGGDQPLPGYTIKRGIGHGGFGEIYYAHSDAGKEVALKLIRRNLDVELRGIRHCLNLKHPNLLDLYDIRQDDQGDTWVVMEYVGGESLEDALADHPQGMPLPMAMAWFHGLAAGVAYLHDRGIVHRDVKPGNVFSNDGVVKVGDYGLSKFVSCSRRSGQTESVGTVHYMAPEVAGGRYGREIDIYAMGVILYEMLTGRLPFEGESVGEVLMKHLTAQPDISALDEPYRSVVERALRKDPAERFDSVEAMLAELPPPEAAPAGGARLPSHPGTRPGNASPGAAAAGARGEAVDADVLGADGWSPTTDDEPILRATREACQSLYASWQRANLNTPARVILILLGLFVLLANLGAVVPAVVVLAILYGCYRLIRWLALPSKPYQAPAGPAPPGAGPRPGMAAPQAAHRAAARHGDVRAGQAAKANNQRCWRRKGDEALEAMVVGSPRERVMELLSAMLLSAPIVLLACAVILLIVSYGGHAPAPAQVAWLACVSLAGTWAVLIPAKYWEGSRGEPLLRRLMMLVVGMALGCLAFGLAEFMLVELPPSSQFPPPPNYRLPPSFFAADGTPLAPAYIAVFGTLMALVRWWKQAEPLRSARLRFWPVIISMLAAGLVAGVWHFPQPWLPMAAAAISIAVQLSSRWVPRHERVKQLAGAA